LKRIYPQIWRVCTSSILHDPLDANYSFIVDLGVSFFLGSNIIMQEALNKVSIFINILRKDTSNNIWLLRVVHHISNE